MSAHAMKQDTKILELLSMLFPRTMIRSILGQYSIHAQLSSFSIFGRTYVHIQCAWNNTSHCFIKHGDKKITSVADQQISSITNRISTIAYQILFHSSWVLCLKYSHWTWIILNASIWNFFLSNIIKICGNKPMRTLVYKNYDNILSHISISSKLYNLFYESQTASLSNYWKVKKKFPEDSPW